jgi:hypothetical protein
MGGISKVDEESKLLIVVMTDSMAFRSSVIWNGQFLMVVLPATISSLHVAGGRL